MSAPTGRVKVSVVTITYNQARYIAEAVDSVLMQAGDFDLEYIVADDASSDGTQAVLQAYQESHPDRIQVVLRDRNVGAQRNLADALSKCTGRYVALLDGDDFWTSREKLHKQVDFLESHPDCALCFHDVRCVEPDGSASPAVPVAVTAARLDLKDLLRENFISSCSVMYRWGLVPSLPGWWTDTWIGDWPLHLLHAQYGWIGHIPEIMAAYRVHGGGLWSGQVALARADEFLKTLGFLDETLGPAHHEAVQQSIFANRYHAFSESWKDVSSVRGRDKRRQARRGVAWLLRNIAHRGDVSVYRVMVLAIQGMFPVLIPPLVSLKARLRRRRGDRPG